MSYHDQAALDAAREALYQRLPKTDRGWVNSVVTQAIQVYDDFRKRNDAIRPGPTRDHPLGKLNASDQGGLNMALTVKNDRVILVFGTEVAWIGMDKRTALALGKSIIEKVESL